jgi:type IV secretory pathway ATPase VirB11/archaellum biosynthesis ATPase
MLRGEEMCQMHADKVTSSFDRLYLGNMTTRVERNKNDEVVITISGGKDAECVQRLVDYLSYLLATEGSQAKQEDIDELARASKAAWWKKNKKRYLGEDRR